MRKPLTAKLTGRALIWMTVSCGGLVVIATWGLLQISLSAVAQRTNEIDNRRTAEALSGAVSLSQTQMANLVEVNSVWDDAVVHAYAPRLDLQWLGASWGALAKAGGDYDGVYIIGGDGELIWGAVDMVETPHPRFSDLGVGTRSLYATSRSSSAQGQTPVSGLSLTSRGLAFVSIGLIQPSSSAVRLPAHQARYLVLTRRVDRSLITSYTKAYALRGLELVPPGTKTAGPSVAMTDAGGRALAALTWSSRNTGLEAARAAWPMVTTALCLITLVMTGLIFAIISGIRLMAKSRNMAKAMPVTDALTGLPNRRAIVERLAACLDGNAALAVIDLDHFKLVNESHGTEVGDQALQAFARRLSSCLVTSVMGARMGGDQFAILCEGAMAAECVAHVLERLHAASADPVGLDNVHIVMTASAGMAQRDGCSTDGDGLLSHADAALAEAKRRAHGSIVQYDRTLDASLSLRRVIAREIVTGLQHNEFAVAYQPIVASDDGTMTAVEALLRWPGRGAGVLGPDTFIEIAEHFGHIHALWTFLVRRACVDIRPFEHLLLQVNLSPVQFGDPRLLADLRDVLEATGFPASRLIVEVTEGRMIDLQSQAADVIKGLHAQGISVALDDFGTGYSSIGSLRQFGFDKLKIDKSLCDRVVEDAQTGALVAATVALARALGIPVTAEGIETAEQASLLHLAGCQSLQGYYYGRPQSLADLTHRVAETIRQPALGEAILAG